jgi:lysophospholipase
MNGRTEWIEKYSYLPADMELEDDVGFLTWDHRGQGASIGERGFIKDYSNYGDDAQRVIQRVVKTRSYVVIGHSMGGLIALHAAMTGKIKPAALVISSPLLALPEKPIPEALARPISAFLGSLAATTKLSTGAGAFNKGAFEGNPLTSDHSRYQFIKSTPYPLGGAKFGWVRATFAAIDFVNLSENLKKYETPTLVLTGSDERVTEPAGIQRWISNAAVAAKAKIQFDVIHGARHELFSETPMHYQRALELIREFLLASVS